MAATGRSVHAGSRAAATLIGIAAFTVLISTVSGETKKPSLEQACPANMVDMAGYCIDREPTRVFLNWYEAGDQCHGLGKRLCTNNEWIQACDAAPLNGAEGMPGRQSEWLSSWVFEPSDQVFDALEHGYFRCRTSSHPWPTYRPYEIKWYRCCASCNAGGPAVRPTLRRE